MKLRQVSTLNALTIASVICGINASVVCAQTKKILRCATKDLSSVELSRLDTGVEAYASWIEQRRNPPTNLPQYTQVFFTSTNSYNARTAKNTVPTINVAVHVITKGSKLSEGNVTDGAIDSQIKILNQSYKGVASFRKKSVDRTNNAAWFAMRQDSLDEQMAKESLKDDSPTILNLYTANPPADRSGQPLGWATFPSSLIKDAKPKMDGVVILYTTLPGGGEPNFDLGYTAVHEVGHWLGLLHTFQGECSDYNDRINDTPAETAKPPGCPPDDTDTCPKLPGKDPIHNFMNYSYDICLNQFSSEQQRQMGFIFNIYRLSPTQIPKSLKKP
jgi:hypothetical protein